jgi:GTP-binding protein
MQRISFLLQSQCSQMMMMRKRTIPVYTHSTTYVASPFNHPRSFHTTHSQQMALSKRKPSTIKYSKEAVVQMEPDDKLRIAIIGRPNTGKSTLFNALTGRYHAIVDKKAGVTRDCQEGTAQMKVSYKVLGNLAKKVSQKKPTAIECTMIDTPGADNIDRMIIQTEESVKSADLAIILTDYKSGIQEWDIQIARYAMLRGIPAIHVVNKCDNIPEVDYELEDHELPGLGKPIPVSAEKKYGLQDLTYIIQPFYTRHLMNQFLKDVEYKKHREEQQLDEQEEEENLEEEEETETEQKNETELDTLRLAIIGRANVGKSTMLNQLIGKESVVVSPIPGTTRDTIEVNGMALGRRILLADTAGLRKQKHIYDDRVQMLSAEDALRTIKYSHVCILLIDSMQPLTSEDLEIAAMIEREGRGLVIGANKWDLITEPYSVAQDIESKVIKSLSQIQGLSVVVCSGMKGKNVKLLMQKAIECFDKWNFRVSTARLNSFIQQYLATKQLPASFPKIQYLTQVSSRPPTFAVFFKRGEELPRNFERQITNAIRTEFGLDGIPVRIVQKSTTVTSRKERLEENRQVQKEKEEARATTDKEFAQKLEKKREQEKLRKKAEMLAKPKKTHTNREKRRFAKKQKAVKRRKSYQKRI